jgi:hypothetical protein
VIFDALDNAQEMKDASGEVVLPKGRLFHLRVNTVPVAGANVHPPVERSVGPGPDAVNPSV